MSFQASFDFVESLPLWTWSSPILNAMSASFQSLLNRRYMAPTLYEGVFKKISSIEAFIEKCTVINESRVGIISDAFSATHLGYSAALVAFVIGSILAETKEVHRIVG